MSFFLTSAYMIWYYFISCEKGRDKCLKKYIKQIVLFTIAAVFAGVIFFLANTDKHKKCEYDIVFLGDSVIGNHAETFSVTSVMEERLGVDVFNGALGGTSMSFFCEVNWESVPAAQWSMVKLAQAICTGDWTSQLAGISYSEYYFDVVRQVMGYFGERIHHLSQIDFSQVDILLIEHGTNDYNGGQPLDSNEDSFDVTTYGGALRTTVSLLQEKYPNLRIILVSPVYCEFLNRGNAKCFETDFGGGVLDDYVMMQKTIAEEYDLEWIDLYHNSGIWSDTIDIYTHDKMHLTVEGQQLIGDYISDYLEENPQKPEQQNRKGN